MIQIQRILSSKGFIGWIDEANKLFGLAGDEPTDDWSMNIWNEAYGYFMKADLFAIDHAPFILKYQKDHPEIKDRFLVMKEQESEFKAEPRENCGSLSKSLYSDGHTFCFVCHHYVYGDGTVNNNVMTTNVQLKDQPDAKTRNF